MSGTPSSKGSRLLASVMVAVALVMCTAIGSRLVDVPPSLPGSFWEWLELVFGAILILFTALIVPFVPKMVGFVASVISRRRLVRILFRRPWRLAVSGVTLAVIIVFASQVPRPSTGADLEPGTIYLMSGFDESRNDARRILVDQWNRSHPNNRAEFVDAGGEPDDQHTPMVDDAKQGGAHAADIYALDIVWMEEFIKNGYIRPLDESRRTTPDAGFVDTVLDTCRELGGDNSVLWALPLNTDVGVMYFRSDLVTKPPENWGDYYGGSAKTILAGVRNKPALATAAAALQSANAAQLTDEEILTVSALEAIWAQDGQLVNKDGRLVMNGKNRNEILFDDNTTRALQGLAAAAKDPDLVAPDLTSNRKPGRSDNEAVTDFKSGATLFMRNWPVIFDKLRQNDIQRPVPFGVAPLPHPSALGGQNLAISASSKRPHAAQALIEFLTSEPSELILATVGGFAPTQESAYQSGSGAARPYNAFLLDTVRGARLRPRIRAYTEFSIEFRRGVQRALNNNGVVEDDLPRRLADIAKK